jgi:hypothetical protein
MAYGFTQINSPINYSVKQVRLAEVELKGWGVMWKKRKMNLELGRSVVF